MGGRKALSDRQGWRASLYTWKGREIYGAWEQGPLARGPAAFSPACLLAWHMGVLAGGKTQMELRLCTRKVVVRVLSSLACPLCSQGPGKCKDWHDLGRMISRQPSHCLVLSKTLEIHTGSGQQTLVNKAEFSIFWMVSSFVYILHHADLIL